MSASSPIAAGTDVPSRRERRKLRSEEAILDAARRLFQEKGLSTTTMQDISELADVAQGTVYNYFPSKDALTVAVVRRMINEYCRAFLEQPLNRPKVGPTGLVVFACVSLIDKGVSDPMWRVLVERYDVLVDALHDGIREFALRNLRDAVSLGEIRATPQELDMQWRIGSWMLAGAIRDIVQGRMDPKDRFTIAFHILLQKGVEPTQAKRIVRKVRAFVGDSSG